jgi:hypothetical protein
MKSLLLGILLLGSCGLPSLEEVEFNGTYAIPLINDKITFQDIAGQSERFDVLVASNGALTLRYNARLFSENIEELLPSIPSIGEVAITDTLSFFALAASDNFVITKAIFNGDEMRFRYSHDQDEILQINMQIPELTKDGEIFEFDYELLPQATLPFTEFTQSFNLEGYEFNSDENLLTFRYDARNPEGERIQLTFAAMSFNQLKFKYAEGSFERTEYDLIGDSIVIDVFDGWKSGEIEFEDPKISFDINHSYGFPIALRINEVLLKTIDNENKYLITDQLGQEIPLVFADLNEVGNVKETKILFDKSNSNINTLFNEKIKYIDYDVDAIINPSGDLGIKGFISDESFFTLDVNLDIPLRQKVNNLILSDTFEIEGMLPDGFSSAELKIITQNTYPINASFNLIFLDESNNVVERLFGNDPLLIEPSDENTRFVDLDASQINILKNSKKILVEPLFDTSSISDDFVQFSDDEFLELRVGLKFKL